MKGRIYDELPDGIIVRIVDGGKVRTAHPGADFLVGGHGYVYSFIPKREIWIEDTSDKFYIMVHEAVEYFHMREGMSYKEAHKLALAAEKRARRGGKVSIEIRGTEYAICKPSK